MTVLINQSRTNRGGAGANRLAVILYALVLAAASHVWLALSGARGWAPPTGQFLADAVVTLPVLAVGVWVAIRLTRRLLDERDPDETGLVPPVALTLVVAATGSVLRAITLIPSLGWSSPVAQATTLMPVAVLAAAMVTVMLVKGRPWQPASRAGSGGTGRGRLVVASLGFASVASFGVIGLSLSTLAVATGPGSSACPDGTPIRDYRVKAIDVDMTLNRFGDHDPLGKMMVLTGYGDPASRRAVGDGQGAHFVATGEEAKVRIQEASKHVSIGLRDDPIQPLTIRGNVGECVEIQFTNGLAAGAAGIHIDGLAYDIESSGDQLGRNPSSATTPGMSHTYRYYVPDDPDMEGVRYIRPGVGLRDLVNHGLFGAFVVEPKDSTWMSSYVDGQSLESGWGWEAIIVPKAKKAFREHVNQFHEIGDEKYRLTQANGLELPFVDPITTAYRPGSRAINYRSEPFMNRLAAEHRGKAFAYNSFTFGDPATPMPRSYLGDPTKIRILHAGSEVLHVYHLHGGGIRWRLNPKADRTFDYQDTGLNKSPKQQGSESSRLDSQSQAPGEGFDLEIEGGAGGVQQSAGDFLYHCHIAEHYVAGMWSFWRTYDTHQRDLATLPDRQSPPNPVDSSALVGKTFNGTTIHTATDLKNWIEPQIPTKGTPLDWDSSVWNWGTDPADPTRYLGAPEYTTAWANLPTPADDSRPWDPTGQPRTVAGHPGLYLGDTLVGNRPKLLFNPVNGRPAYPLLRPQIGLRAPFSPNGHSGAPWLGEHGTTTGNGVWDNRPDGICPTGAPVKHFNLVSINLRIQITRAGAHDNLGKLFTLAADKDAVRSGTKPKDPLALRLNEGDCGFVTLTSEQPDDDEQPFSMTNAHIHHVQFDVQASDGVGTGLAFGQAVRPYRLEDTTLVSSAASGSNTLSVATPPPTSADGLAKFRPGVWIAIGEGTEGIEVRQIATVIGTTITLTAPLANAHPAGEWTGTEFVQYIWYPDVKLDNVFWHDHVDAIRNWGHGLVGQLIVEPKGSTYHDPTTGAEVRSGTVVDIHATNALIPGVVDKSFREFAMWTIDENPKTDSTINLRAEPLDDRLAAHPDPSQLLSSRTHGDPFTPVPRAYPGDDFVIRTINVSPGVDTFTLDGHTFKTDSRLTSGAATQIGTPKDAVPYGISETYSLALDGGAGGLLKEPGDYLYGNGIGRRFRQGAWGLIRVLNGPSPDLRPLPESVPPPAVALPGGPGNPCPVGSPKHEFDVTAVNVPAPSPGVAGITAAFVPSADAHAAKAGALRPDPLVLHVAEGECLEVSLTNDLNAPATTGTPSPRVSFHVAELLASRRSSGINVGLTPEQTVAVGESRVYRYYANDHKVGAALVSDYGGLGTGPTGLSAAIVVGPKDAQFRDSLTGTPTDVGVQVDVSAPGTEPYRDLTAIVSDNDAVIGQNFMPYPRFVEGSALLNGKAAPRAEDTGDVPSAYSSAAGDPPTVFTAAVGDRVVVHALGASSSEQVHGFSVGGLPWRRDMDVPRSEVVTIDRVGANVSLDFELMRGSSAARPGDYFVGDLRGPFTQAGLHGLLRVSTFNDAAPGTPRSLADLPGYVPPVAPPRSAAAPVAASAPGQSARPEPASTVVGEHRSDDRKNLRITSRTTSRRLGRVSTHEVTITNPNGVPVKLTHVVQCLPVGLRYVPRSTTGRITSAPRVGKCGRTSASRRFAATGPVSLSLTWSSAITVPANGKVTFRYMARMSRTR